jgi:hypothetical protein
MLSVGIRAQRASMVRRWPRRGRLLVGVLLLTWALSAAPGVGAGLSPSQVVRLWLVFYGQQDTLHAAGFTTARFRQGQVPAVWAAHMFAMLHQVDYQHLGGEIISAAVSETEATIVLRATVHTRQGTSTQTETYRLQRYAGRWLIDRLEVTEQGHHDSDPEDRSPSLVLRSAQTPQLLAALPAPGRRRGQRSSPSSRPVMHASGLPIVATVRTQLKPAMSCPQRKRNA